MGTPTRCATTVVGALALSGILASAALGDSCATAVRWNDVVYTGQTYRFAVLERGRRLGEAEVPSCTGGACAPPEQTTPVFAIEGVPTAVAIVDTDSSTSVYVAPGTFPQLPDHPLHDALYGLPTRPDHRSDCGLPFELVGSVSGADFNLRIEVDDADGPGAGLEGEETALELDVESRIVGFDRDGIPTLGPGDRVRVTLRYCRIAEADWPLVDRLGPASGS